VIKEVWFLPGFFVLLILHSRKGYANIIVTILVRILVRMESRVRVRIGVFPVLFSLFLEKVKSYFMKEREDEQGKEFYNGEICNCIGPGNDQFQMYFI